MTNLTMTEKASLFDECLKELSPEAQAELTAMVEVISKAFARGGGEMSAKEYVLMWAISPIREKMKHEQKEESNG